MKAKTLGIVLVVILIVIAGILINKLVKKEQLPKISPMEIRIEEPGFEEEPEMELGPLFEEPTPKPPVTTKPRLKKSDLKLDLPDFGGESILDLGTIF
jgi:hypothetical protein